MFKRIFKSEMSYFKCFSQVTKAAGILRFRDYKLPEMYDHNFSFVEGNPSPSLLAEIVQAEREQRASEGADFCNIKTTFPPEALTGLSLPAGADISQNGFYVFDLDSLAGFKEIDGLTVRRIEDASMLEDVLFCDLKHDEKKLGREFCEKRCYRRGEVYLCDGALDSYVCYHHGQPVGNCDLLITENTAKIEDFAVIPECQRRGYGTTILKRLIVTARERGCDLIYLVADEEDTAKNMYLKLGFRRVCVCCDLFFK